MYKIQKFISNPFVILLIISGLFMFSACSKVENELPVTGNTPTIVLPKLMTSGPQDSIAEQENFIYNAQGQLEQIKGVNKKLITFYYQNGQLSSKKLAFGGVLNVETTYTYQNGNLVSFKETYPNAPDHFTKFEIAAVDANGFPTKILVKGFVNAQEVSLNTLTYVWKNGNVISVEMKNEQCHQSGEMVYDDKPTLWHQFQNPLKNPHFLDNNMYCLGKYYSKNNEITLVTPHCSDITTSYTYNNLGLPISTKYYLTGKNNFVWERIHIHKYQ